MSIAPEITFSILKEACNWEYLQVAHMIGKHAYIQQLSAYLAILLIRTTITQASFSLSRFMRLLFMRMLR